MIEYVVPIGVTARRGDAELGLTWLIVGDDWMILDYATRGAGGHGQVSLADNRGRLYTAIGSSSASDPMGLLRHHACFGEALDPRATELRVLLAASRRDRVIEISFPLTERVPPITIAFDVLPIPKPPPTLVTCVVCARATDRHVCDECRNEGLTFVARRSGQLVPAQIAPLPVDLALVGGLQHSVAGIVGWEHLFDLRYVFRAAPGERSQLGDPPRLLAHRWTGEDSKGRTFIGRPKRWGYSESEGRAVGDAEIEFMPALDVNAGPLLLRAEAAGALVAELELPLTAAS